MVTHAFLQGKQQFINPLGNHSFLIDRANIYYPNPARLQLSINFGRFVADIIDE